MSVWTYEVAFVEIDVSEMWHIEGKLTRDRFNWKAFSDGRECEPPASWDGRDVRVRVRYASQERDVLAGARERVKAMFAGVRRFEFEPIAIQEHALRAPEVVQATTLDEKLRAWARLSDVAWSDEIDRCASVLLSTEDADAVVAEVESRLSAVGSSTSGREPAEYTNKAAAGPTDLAGSVVGSASGFSLS